VTQPAELAARALQHVAATLSTLPTEQLQELAAGRGRLVYLPQEAAAAPVASSVSADVPVHPGTAADPTDAVTVPATRSAPPPAPAPAQQAQQAQPARVDVAAAVADISALTSREQVTAYLRARDRELNVPALRQIARGLGPTVSAAAKSKADLHRNIVEGTAGFRERSAAMAGRGGW
jgi:hypothetical protein